MPETSQEQHGERFAVVRLKLVAPRVDPGAQVSVDTAGNGRLKAGQIVAVGGTAHLNAVELRKHAKLIPDRAQVFESRLYLRQGAAHHGQLAADGLEIHVVLEQDARQLAKIHSVLGERCIFQLYCVDAPGVDLAVDQPLQVAVGEFRNGVRKNRSQGLLFSLHSDDIFHRAGIELKMFVRRAFPLMVQQNDEVKVRLAGQMVNGLGHENRAAVNGWSDGIGRDE